MLTVGARLDVGARYKHNAHAMSNKRANSTSTGFRSELFGFKRPEYN